ncbi:hypothetical protein AB833_09030 [Chromatiales bacterium (ex Bugula neritina AB1)]|nr:hypothetical protein AB833_09030 [Chromatiales bacterium (ex Bugula neritina AB1)]
MSLVLKNKIEGPAAWKGEQIVNDHSWKHQLTAESITTLETALAYAMALQLPLEQLRKEHFPIDENLAAELHDISIELEFGRGFLLLRGLPVERYTEAEIKTVYYGIGLHLGSPVRQNPQGDLLGLVMNVGDIDNKRTRVYETNAYLPYHTDPSDVVGLLCLRKAKSGGLSSLVSCATVYNELLENYREFIALYYRPFYYAHLGKDEPALTPLYSFHNGRLSCRYLRQYIELGHNIMDIPLSGIEIEALDIIDSITHKKNLRLDMMLEPGEIQFANNYAIMHSRTAFEDHEDPDMRRKKFRLWLKMPNARALAPDFPGRNGFPPG